MSIHRPIPVRSEGTFERVLRATGLLFTPRTSPGTHNRGFSLLEVTAGVAAFGILASTVMPPAAEAIRHAGVNRGTAVVAMDLRLASSLASRQRRPVRVTYRSDLDTYTFTDASTGTLLHTRDLSEFKLPSRDLLPVDDQHRTVGHRLERAHRDTRRGLVRPPHTDDESGHGPGGGTMKTTPLKQDGFVLVEAVVALTLLAVVLLPLAGMSYQVASRAVRSTTEMHRTGVMTAKSGRLSVLPFDSLPSAVGCTTVFGSAFPHQSCVSVADLATDVRRVTLVVNPALAMVRSDTVILRRTKPVTANPFSR